MTTNTTTASQPNAAPSDEERSVKGLTRVDVTLADFGGNQANFDAWQAAAPALPEPAAAQGYQWHAVDGQQHDTGRITTPSGNYFATTGSPEDAKLVADALNGVAPQPLVEVSAAQAAPIYQHQSKVDRIGLTHWVDCTRAIYESCPEAQRRIVFASPAAQAVPEAPRKMQVNKARISLCRTCVHEPVAGDTYPCNCCWNPIGDMYRRKPTDTTREV